MAKYIIKCRGIKPLEIEANVTCAEELKEEFFTTNRIKLHDQRYVIAFRCAIETGLPVMGETRQFISGRHNLGSITRIV